MPNLIQTPSKGRIVFFQNGKDSETAMPAVILERHNDDQIDLQAFGIYGGIFENVSYHDGEGGLPDGYSWRWPPRV